jgi:tryptophan-rich sensory protein
LSSRSFRPRWWHALLFGVLANSASGQAGRRAQDRDYYRGLRQLPIAPPAGAFFPVWMVNNAGTLWGNLRLLNQAPGTPGRSAQLAMQGAGWLLYATFGRVYFNRRSPILGFVWTAAHWLLTLASIASARRDPRLAASHATTAAWLTLATPVTAYQAMRNRDELFGYRP